MARRFTLAEWNVINSARTIPDPSLTSMEAIADRVGWQTYLVYYNAKHGSETERLAWAAIELCDAIAEQYHDMELPE